VYVHHYVGSCLSRSEKLERVCLKHAASIMCAFYCCPNSWGGVGASRNVGLCTIVQTFLDTYIPIPVG
jgi:hypothetical protein